MRTPRFYHYSNAAAESGRLQQEPARRIKNRVSAAVSRVVVAVAFATSAFLNNAFAQPAAVPGLPALVDGGQQDQGGTRPVLPSQRYKVEVDLPAVTHDLGAVDLPAAKPSRPLQVGINRSAGVSHAARAQRFRNADGTQISLLAIKSPDAVALRLRFTDFNIRPRDEVYVRGVTDGRAVAGPYTGKGAWSGGEFWSAMIEGDTAVIEYQSKSDEGELRGVGGLAHLPPRGAGECRTGAHGR